MLADRLIVLGVNHKVAPVEIREKLAVSNDEIHPVTRLRALEGCKEVCFLSTCNRVEAILVSDAPDVTVDKVRDFLFVRKGVSAEESKKYSYLYQGSDAVSHIFRVAASLDSMIVGEPQILGQLKQAYRDATEKKAVGVILNRFMDKSFSVAKRVRTETNIGGSAVSISYAAVQLAKKIFGSLEDKRVLLAGAGEMAELAAEHLMAQGIKEVIVANRTMERAVNLARRFNGKAVALTELVDQLEFVDILISSTGSPDLILLKEDVKPIMRKRMNTPLFLIDIAVPRDLDPKLNTLDNVYLYDIDNLKDVVEVNKSEREREAHKAERIVDEEALKFVEWLEGMAVSPLISAIRGKAAEICAMEMGKTMSRLSHLSEKERKSIEALTNAIMSKLLHHPIQFIKQNSNLVDQQTKLALVRQVFGLNDDQDKPDQHASRPTGSAD